MKNKINILNVNIDHVTMDEAVKRALSYIKQGGFHCIFTPNPEIIWQANQDEALMQILGQADMLLADGIGVIIASKILKTPLPERVAGFDFANRLFEQEGLRFFFFGAKPGVAEEAAKRTAEKYKGIQIVGTHHGYFKEEETDAIIEKINQSGADVLLVCLGVPKQEKWIYQNRNKLQPSLCLGVGGTLDGLAGHVKRAPVAFQKMGLEWFYRLLCQPSRIKRMGVLPLFLLKIIFGKKRS